MRCFIAIDLPTEIKKELKNIQEQISTNSIKIKFVEPENLHLTFKFLGELTDNKINKIKEVLREIKFENFKVSLGSLGFFPSQNYIRVIWVDLKPKNQLEELYKKIESALVREGFRADKRNFETHVTLGRVKFVKDKPGFIKTLNAIDVKPLEFQISSFSLKKSTLMRKGPVYENILKF